MNHCHVFYGYELKIQHSKLGNKHETNKHFCSGLHKIQTGNEGGLTALEKNACQWLLKINNPAYKSLKSKTVDLLSDENDVEVVESEEFNLGSMLETHVSQEQSKMDSSVSKYVNTNHFLSSAAIVECLWSKFDALVPQRREGMSPMLIEAILFLKENRDLWSMTEIREALRRVKSNE